MTARAARYLPEADKCTIANKDSEPVVFCVAKTDIHKNEIPETCHKQFLEYMKIREIRFRSSLPFTAVGKIDFNKSENDYICRHSRHCLVPWGDGGSSVEKD